jgi:hypothetical protein
MREGNPVQSLIHLFTLSTVSSFSLENKAFATANMYRACIPSGKVLHPGITLQSLIHLFISSLRLALFIIFPSLANLAIYFLSSELIIFILKMGKTIGEKTVQCKYFIMRISK